MYSLADDGKVDNDREICREQRRDFAVEGISYRGHHCVLLLLEAWKVEKLKILRKRRESAVVDEPPKFVLDIYRHELAHRYLHAKCRRSYTYARSLTCLSVLLTDDRFFLFGRSSLGVCLVLHRPCQVLEDPFASEKQLEGFDAVLYSQRCVRGREKRADLRVGTGCWRGFREILPKFLDFPRQVGLHLGMTGQLYHVFGAPRIELDESSFARPPNRVDGLRDLFSKVV
mmetsp:Transcript_11359/g.21796  ORF Transcript_11359/g.21796 Transcript_11359/m.21796 type:complete len:229 (-) Transcript_11359:232-918(-)